MAENAQGRLDILILRLADELGHRLHAKTMVDFRPELKQVAEHLIADMKIPASPITANSVVRTALGLDRNKSKLRRVG